MGEHPKILVVGNISAIDQAIAASRLGGQITFLGRIDSDAKGEDFLAKLQAEDICTKYLMTNTDISMEDVERALGENYDAVILKLDIPDDIIIGTFKAAKAREMKVVLDMTPARALPLGQLNGIDIISPDEEGASALTGIQVNSFKSANQAAKVFQAMHGPEHVVIRMGSKGAMAFDSCSFKQLPSHEDIVDGKASDDIFIAALTLEYVRSGDIEKATEFANDMGVSFSK